MLSIQSRSICQRSIQLLWRVCYFSRTDLGTFTHSGQWRAYSVGGTTLMNVFWCWAVASMSGLLSCVGRVFAAARRRCEILVQLPVHRLLWGHAIQSALAFSDNYGLGIQNFVYNINPQDYDRSLITETATHSVAKACLKRCQMPK